MEANSPQAFDESLIQLFQDETSEQLKRFQEILLHLAKNPDDQLKTLNELFRIAHNIKGSAGMLGLAELREAMHTAESIFAGVRDRQFDLHPQQIEALLQLVNVAQEYIAYGAWDFTELLVESQATLTGTLPRDSSKQRVHPQLVLSEVENNEINSWQESGKEVYGIEVYYDDAMELPGAAALTFINFLVEYGSIFKTAPEINELRDEEFSGLKLVLLSPEGLTKEQEAAITGYQGHGEQEIKLRKWTYRPREAKHHLKSESLAEHTIRVDFVKIDQLINNIEELTAINSNLAEIFETINQNSAICNQFQTKLQDLERVSDNLQSAALNLRMVPVRHLFSRFPRLAHELAKQLDKKLELVCYGETTEIDKKIAEELVDPLTHLIRNAIDHGLETGPERRAVNKPEVGRITLKVAQEGQQIIVTVSDDGRGLDLEKIRSRALKNKLLSSQEEPSEDQLLKLIFEPGFSTAERINDVSGRGVGMDVVQNSIWALKGEIEIEHHPGQGTTFRLKVPLTLAQIHSFMVRAGDQIYGVPADEVEESLILNDKEFSGLHGHKDYLWRRERIPLVDLARLVKTTRPSGPSQGGPLLIIKHAHARIGLLVEELLGEEKLRIKQIKYSRVKNPLIAGAAVLKDGELVLILDTRAVIRRAAS